MHSSSKPTFFSPPMVSTISGYLEIKIHLKFSFLYLARNLRITKQLFTSLLSNYKTVECPFLQAFTAVS